MLKLAEEFFHCFYLYKTSGSSVLGNFSSDRHLLAKTQSRSIYVSQEIKMFCIFIVGLSMVCTAFGAPVEAPLTTCAGGIQNGVTTEAGRYWYTCQQGKLVMMGCLSTMNSRLTSGQTFKSNGYLLECTSSTNGDFSFAYKGCVSENGEEHLPNDTWQDSNYWYTCTKTDGKVVAEIKGCVDDGKRYNPDESVKKTDLIYECKRFETGQVGWNIYPNRAETVTYNPELDHIQAQQTIPAGISN